MERLRALKWFVGECYGCILGLFLVVIISSTKNLQIFKCQVDHLAA
jgi:hypothetical protein